MAARRSSKLVTATRLRRMGNISSLITVDMGMPARLSSASNISLPWRMFSSRRSFFNHCLILVRAVPLLQMVSQSRLGPGAALLVWISTISPFCSTWVKGTMRPLTLAPIMWLPTAEWME